MNKVQPEIKVQTPGAAKQVKLSRHKNWKLQKNSKIKTQFCSTEEKEWQKRENILRYEWNAAGD